VTECAEVREAIPAFVRDGDVSLAVRRHVSRCAACRDEVGRYERLLSGMRKLSFETVDPPVDLLGTLKMIPADSTKVEEVRRHVARNRRAYAGGVAVALAGAAGVAIFQRRRRVVTA
jgi:anti-sigma factor RsiW